MRISFLLVVLVCALATRHAVAGGAANTIAHHSLFAPFLSTFAENGLPFWSFGGATVITDNAVLLTPPTGSAHGYLWNQQPSGLHEWQARFVVRTNKKPPFSLFSTAVCETCGVAFWHLREPTRHQESHFFGVPDGFVGFGVILRHDGVHVVKNEGQPVTGMSSVKIGGCSENVLTQTGVEVVVEFSKSSNSIKVLLGRMDSSGVLSGNLRQCASISDSSDYLRYYFGFTAQSSVTSDQGFALGHVDVATLNAAEIDSKQGNTTEIVDFDAALDKEDRAFWNGRNDDNPNP